MEEFILKRFYKSNVDDLSEDTTMFGEFVCSFHKWIPLSKQKNAADELANMTNKEEKKSPTN